MSKEAVIQIVYLPISEIRDYENNPRDNDKAVEAVARSIKRFGVRSPAIIDRDNVLIAGHTRIKAAKQLGMTEFPCVRADDLTKNEAKAFRLADNRMQEDSQWDTEALAAEFSALRENGFDLTETGFDEFEIGGIDMSAADYDSSPEDYDTPEAESGEYDPDEEEPEEEDPDEEFAVLIACKDEEEKAMVAEIIGEKEELRRRYTVAQVRKMLESQDTSEDTDAGFPPIYTPDDLDEDTAGLPKAWTDS